MAFKTAKPPPTPGDFLVQQPAAVRPVLQPVIDLDAQAVAGYEALARVGPGYPEVSPDQMFRWARRTGKVNELDWLCRCAAFRVALDQQLHRPMPIFVNAEPAALDSGAPAELLADLQLARRQLRVVVELTERELADNPVQLFRVVDSMRALGWEIAVDDVGAEPISLALLPLLEPDVVKLDRRLVADPDVPEHARIALAVAAEAKRTGATVIVEGVETAEQLATARGWGARYAQGFLWGQPHPRPRTDLPPAPMPPPPRDRRTARPASAATDRRELTDDGLDPLVRMLLTAAGTDPSCVVLTRWPSGAVADPWRRELASLAPRAALVGSATSDDGSCEVVVLGPSLAAALTARPDAERAWTAHVLHDRTEVIHMGQRLVRTIGRTGAVLSHQLLPPYPRAPGT